MPHRDENGRTLNAHHQFRVADSAMRVVAHGWVVGAAKLRAACGTVKDAGRTANGRHAFDIHYLTKVKRAVAGLSSVNTSRKSIVRVSRFALKVPCCSTDARANLIEIASPLSV